MEEDILMNNKEVERCLVLEMVNKKELKLSVAAEQMGVCYRQAKRLFRAYKQRGKAGLVSKHRGKRSNRGIPAELEKRARGFLVEHYADFSAVFAMEKLHKQHGIKLSREKVRQLMIQAGVYQSRRKRSAKGVVHQRRRRRERFGELIQIDGSFHDWFEGRAEKSTLIAGIDDATGRIVSAHFEARESTNGYFRMAEQHFRKFGLPQAYYSDKYGVFRVNHGEGPRKKTQFTAAMNRLRVEVICAHSPQAKGRIERLFGTLQDRLVKEMRLRGISSVKEANLFLLSYIEEHNEQFGVSPTNPIDAHRSLKHDFDLSKILCKRRARKVTKNLEVSWGSRILQIQAPDRANRLKGVRVEVLETARGEIFIEYKGELLEFVEFFPFSNQPITLDSKDLEVHKTGT
jgi:molybdenum-dependent DNA-binding transcriptional regulator ModE